MLTAQTRRKRRENKGFSFFALRARLPQRCWNKTFNHVTRHFTPRHVGLHALSAGIVTVCRPLPRATANQLDHPPTLRLRSRPHPHSHCLCAVSWMTCRCRRKCKSHVDAKCHRSTHPALQCHLHARALNKFSRAVCMGSWLDSICSSVRSLVMPHRA